MQSLDMLTINEELTNKEDLMEIIWKAFEYFPGGVWEAVKYVGNMNVKRDLEIKSEERVYEAFIFANLIRKIREMKNQLRIKDLLLGVTHSPVIVTYHRLELERLKRMIYLVHDYVSYDVGMISFFETDDNAQTQIAAHGLGHSQGLEHHAKPIDLMYARLLDVHPIKIDGFCKECQRKLKNKKSSESE